MTKNSVSFQFGDSAINLLSTTTFGLTFELAHAENDIV